MNITNKIKYTNSKILLPYSVTIFYTKRLNYQSILIKIIANVFSTAFNLIIKINYMALATIIHKCF